MITATGSSVKKRRSTAHALCCRYWRKMEVYVRASTFGFANWIFPEESVVREVLDRFVQKQVELHIEQDQNQEKCNEIITCINI